MLLVVLSRNQTTPILIKISEFMSVPYLAKDLEDFFYRITNNYLRHGYTRYVLRTIPPKKDPEAVDRKLIFHYRITYNRSARARAKVRGKASVAYVRYKHFFVLLATEGEHKEFDRLGWSRFSEQRLYICGYAIGLQGQFPTVELTPKRFRGVRKFMIKIAFYPEKRLVSFLDRVFGYDFYALQRQRKKIVTHVNKKRNFAGRSKLSVQKKAR